MGIVLQNTLRIATACAVLSVSFVSVVNESIVAANGMLICSCVTTACRTTPRPYTARFSTMVGSAAEPSGCRSHAEDASRVTEGE